MKMLVFSKDMAAAKEAAKKAPKDGVTVVFVTDEEREVRDSIHAGWRPDLAFVATNEDQQLLSALGVAASVIPHGA